ncbi:MAG: hypothetical protein GY793_05875 [Proteobacteria bacterium]|nr:hypothetical protein [Pseudomonadota bacterium]
MLTFFVALLITAVMYYNHFVLPQKLTNLVNELTQQNSTLISEKKLSRSKNDAFLIENGSLLQELETERIKLAELQVQANIVEKIKKESLQEIESYRVKMQGLQKQLDFYNELMSPSVKQELQCFNMEATTSKNKKYVDYGLNFMLDKKIKDSKQFLVEFRLLSGSNNIELTEKLPEELAPDIIRNISIKTSIRLTGKIKQNNKLKGLKVLDVRVFNKSKNLVAQCWKVF